VDDAALPDDSVGSMVRRSMTPGPTREQIMAEVEAWTRCSAIMAEAAREDGRERRIEVRVAMAVTAIIFLMAAAVAYFT
jgi:hypothetical protein